MEQKKLSIVIPARNDSYMGNSNWRLETTINFIADQLESINCLQDVEIIIVDWGSSSPLRSVINVSVASEQVVRYIEVPFKVHEEVCQGSDFPIAIAINVGIRRAKGEFIALSSGDILWGCDVLRSFVASGNDNDSSLLSQSMVVIPRKNIPWDFVSRNPAIVEMTKYIENEGAALEVEPLMPFYMGCSGAMVMHKDLWAECCGNDERLVFWGYNDIDLCLRIRLKYKCIDYHETDGFFLYHLEHYPSRTENTFAPKRFNFHVFSPLVVNDRNWGLARHSFAEFPKPAQPQPLLPSNAREHKPTQMYRVRHLLNILSFSISKLNLKHFDWSYSVLHEFAVDTLKRGNVKPIDEPSPYNQGSRSKEKRA